VYEKYKRECPPPPKDKKLENAIRKNEEKMVREK